MFLQVTYTEEYVALVKFALKDKTVDINTKYRIIVFFSFLVSQIWVGKYIMFRSSKAGGGGVRAQHPIIALIKHTHSPHPFFLLPMTFLSSCQQGK